jgi:hypothetical protein
MGCTLTVEQWLANARHEHDRSNKFRDLCSAIAAVHVPLNDLGGPRCEPRIGYDWVNDNVLFIFKASERGVTFLVRAIEVDPGGE